MNARPLTIALPKGRLMERGLALLRDAGLDVAVPAGGRQLMYHFPALTVLELRNSDVPTYVDLGVADLGIVGKDQLAESGRDVYEPIDLGFGRCRLSLIRPAGASTPILRVATKFPRLTARFLRERGLSAEIVKLGGNIELAALTGLADAVVDLVQTGATLAANGLVESEVLMPSSARLIVNRAALKLRQSELRPLISRLRELVETQRTA